MIDYNNFLSEVAKSRQPSPIRSLLPLERTPGLISLLAGKPNSTTFPFTTFSFTVRSPTASGGEEETTLELKGAELDEALQYSETPGLKRLLDWLGGLQESVHGRSRGEDPGNGEEGWRVSMGSGSQDIINKAVINILNPGDPILVETPVYAGVIPMFTSLGLNVVPVPTDGEGIDADELERILAGWGEGKGRKPKVLYTVPYGCNPTGMTATLPRRLKVLQLARKHDFLILEDDPYFYLYFGERARPASYFSLDNPRDQGWDGNRVLRFDSLSKILSSGIRIGWLTGPPTLVTAIERHTATANLQTPTLTQSIIYKLLDRWGYEGFIEHTRRVSEFYRKKRDVFDDALVKHFGPSGEGGKASWVRPEAGMFYWFRMEGIEDASVFVRQKAFEEGVLALPGDAFLPSAGPKSPYVRAAFSIPTDVEIDLALGRLRAAYDAFVVSQDKII